MSESEHELFTGAMATQTFTASDMLQQIATAMLDDRPPDQIEYAAAVAYAQVAFMRAIVAEAIRSGLVNDERAEALYAAGLNRDLDAAVKEGAEAGFILDAHNQGTLGATAKIIRMKPAES